VRVARLLEDLLFFFATIGTRTPLIADATNLVQVAQSPNNPKPATVPTRPQHCGQAWPYLRPEEGLMVLGDWSWLETIVTSYYEHYWVVAMEICLKNRLETADFNISTAPFAPVSPSLSRQ
jgi:hypothetical protein